MLEWNDLYLYTIAAVTWNEHSLFFSGSITSVKVQGLSSGAHYFFKLGASTEVGPGPYSLVKEVHTPTQKYGTCPVGYL